MSTTPETPAASLSDAELRAELLEIAERLLENIKLLHEALGLDPPRPEPDREGETA